MFGWEYIIYNMHKGWIYNKTTLFNGYVSTLGVLTICALYRDAFIYVVLPPTSHTIGGKLLKVIDDDVYIYFL